MPRFENKAWIVIYTDAFGEDSYVIWTDKENAYFSAASWAQNKARKEMYGLDWGEQGAPDELPEVIQAFESQQYEEAYLAWRKYADGGEVSEDIKVIEAPMGEVP